MLHRFILLCVFACAAATSAATPNIVFIMADDLGYGDVQCLNPERGKIATPHLDKLAAGGMTFTDAHSGSSVCTPTRYGLLTGRYAWRTRLQSGVLDGGNDEPLIAADRLTVPALLKAHGYATACIGKWHLGFTSEAVPARGAAKKAMGSSGLPMGATIIGGPTTRGFDYFWGCSNARTMSSLIENEQVVESLPPVEMLPRLTQRAAAYLAERSTAANSAKPFFLYVALTSPHTPIVPSAEWQGRSGLGDYADFVMQTDATVGAILAALDRHPMAGNTLVIFTSDNGCSPQARTDQLERRGHFASGPFRGYKADIWDGGHRVPFFARWPGQITAGTRSGALVCLTDFMATCAEILNAPLPPNAAVDSISMLPTLLQRAGAPVRETVVHHSINGRFAIRDRHWKLNLCSGSGGWSEPTGAVAKKEGLPRWQLYDMQKDPGESTNLADARPDVATELSTMLEKMISGGRSTPGPPQRNDAEVLPRQ